MVIEFQHPFNYLSNNLNSLFLWFLDVLPGDLHRFPQSLLAVLEYLKWKVIALEIRVQFEDVFVFDFSKTLELVPKGGLRLVVSAFELFDGVELVWVGGEITFVSVLYFVDDRVGALAKEQFVLPIVCRVEHLLHFRNEEQRVSILYFWILFKWSFKIGSSSGNRKCNR